jgi:hypothetical protein
MLRKGARGNSVFSYWGIEVRTVEDVIQLIIPKTVAGIRYS